MKGQRASNRVYNLETIEKEDEGVVIKNSQRQNKPGRCVATWGGRKCHHEPKDGLQAQQPSVPEQGQMRPRATAEAMQIRFS